MPNTITTTQGRRFTIRTVHRGEGYGVDDKIIHGAVDPIVEFYDLDHTDRFGPRGQFVARYHATTLAHHAHDAGLSLDGGVPAWDIDAVALAPVLSMARTLHGPCPSPECPWDRHTPA